MFSYLSCFYTVAALRVSRNFDLFSVLKTGYCDLLLFEWKIKFTATTTSLADLNS